MPPKRKVDAIFGATSKRQKRARDEGPDLRDPNKWWKGDKGPHPSGLPDDPCPIDWRKVHDVDPMLQELYLLRSPWKESPDNSFAKVQALMNKKYGTPHNTETWRKRFHKVNRIVFKATGIWYERFSGGLEAHLGKAPKIDRVKSGMRKMLRTPVMRYNGDTFTLYIQEPNMMEGAWNEQREVPIDAACEVSPRFRAAVKKNQFAMVVEATPRLIDILFSVLFPRRRSTFPRRAFRLRRNQDNENVFDDIVLDISVDDIFDLYILAASWNSSPMCDLIIDHWRRIYHEEETLREEYLTGSRHFGDVPKGPVANILDFEPKHLNLLWTSTHISANDTVHAVWLDILISKGEVGFETITDNFADYDIKFLVDWYKRLNPEQRAKVAPLFKEFHPNPTLQTIEDEDTEQADPQRNPALVLSGSANQVCALYHNHKRARKPCYLQSVVPTAVMADDREQQAIIPAHHVKMTINGIPGFLVHNHTGYSTSEFQDLPKVFPHWDWERVRAVNCYEEAAKSQYAPRNKNLYTLPHPAYFDDGYRGGEKANLADEFGRWPSHPGFCDPDWQPPAPTFEDEDDEHEGTDDEDDPAPMPATPLDEDDAEASDEEVNLNYSQEIYGGVQQQDARNNNSSNGDAAPRVVTGRWREFMFDRVVDKNEAPLPLYSKAGFGFEPYGSSQKFWY